jgi:hypothetical protein
MLRYEAALHAANGDYKGAARSVKTSFALARTLRSEPILISELVRIACVAISVESLERLITEHSFDTDELADFSRELEQAEQDGRQSAFRAMIGERAFKIPYFASLQSINQLMGSSSESVSPIQTISFGTFKALGLHDRDLRLYLEMMSKFVAASTNDFPEMLRQGDQVQTEMSQRLSHGFGRLAVLTRMMTPAINKAFNKEAALATRLRCARIALAVEKYRLANHSLPPNLDALVPDFLEKPLVDPVEGRPFRLEALRTTNGYQITSPLVGKKLQNMRTATFTVSR